MTVTADGFTLDRTEPTFPVDAYISCWVPGNSYTVSESPAMIACKLLPYDQVTIEWYAFSNSSTPFVFQGGKFVKKEAEI